MTISSLSFGPLHVHRLTQSQALDRVAQLVANRRGGFIVTPNVDHIVLAHQDPQLQQDYAAAALSLADGQPLLWMARLLGQPLPEKVSGSDLLQPLMQRAAQDGWRVFLVGGTPSVANQARDRMREAAPGLQIVGHDSSRWAIDDLTPPVQSALVASIRSARADLVVVALGCPKQERWMAKHAAAIAPAVAIGLGGALDFAAGAVRRAPRWMSRAGLEWLFRLAQEPRRLAYRYLVRDPQVLPIFARAWWQHVTRRGAPAVPRWDV